MNGNIEAEAEKRYDEAVEARRAREAASRGGTSAGTIAKGIILGVLILFGACVVLELAARTAGFGN